MRPSSEIAAWISSRTSRSSRDVAQPRRRPAPRELLELVGGFAEPALVDVADHHRGAFLGAAPGRGEPDAGAGGGGDQHRLAGEEIVALDVGGDRLAHRVVVPLRSQAGRGSRGRPSARSLMMLRWISLDPA